MSVPSRVLLFISLCVAMGFPYILMAQVVNPIVIDRSLSSITAAEDLTSIDEFINHYEQELIPQRLSLEDTKGSNRLGILYRFAKAIVEFGVQDELISLSQHEIFGHGARLREFGTVGIEYEVGLIPPHGTTSWGENFWDANVTFSRVAAVHIAGMEAEEILGDENRLRALERGQINYRESFLYFEGRLAMTFYAWSTRSSDLMTATSNDIANYVDLVGLMNPHVNLRAVQTQSLINLLDPLTLDWFYSYCYQYLYRGNAESEMPMFSIGSWRCLPGLRFALTPFGYEYSLEGLFADSGKVLNVSGRLGTAYDGMSYGIGVDAHRLLAYRQFGLDWKMRGWRQPGMWLGGADVLSPSLLSWKMGGLITATPSYRLPGRLSILAEVGYKSRGFVEGEMLEAGPFLRAGFAFEK